MEDFLQGREIQESEGRPKTTKECRSPPGNCPRCGLASHSAGDCPKLRKGQEMVTPTPQMERKTRSRSGGCTVLIVRRKDTCP